MVTDGCSQSPGPALRGTHPDCETHNPFPAHPEQASGLITGGWCPLCVQSKEVTCPDLETPLASPAVSIGVRVKKFHNEFISNIENLLSKTELNYGQEWRGSQKERRTYTVMSNSLRRQTEWTHLLSVWP